MTQELPLSDNTLLYGSVDAGQTVLADPQVAPAVEDLAAKLNLKSERPANPMRRLIHFCCICSSVLIVFAGIFQSTRLAPGSMSACLVRPYVSFSKILSKRIEIPRACADHSAPAVDLEVHRADKDGRTYMVDTHRLMPAVAPSLVARSFIVVDIAGDVVHSGFVNSADDMLRLAQETLGVPHVAVETATLDSGLRVAVVFGSTATQKDEAAVTAGAAAAGSYAAAAAAAPDYRAGADCYGAAEMALCASHVSYGAAMDVSATSSRAEPRQPSPEQAGANRLMSRILGRPIVGAAAVFFNCSSTWRHMYQLLRPEAVRASSAQLSSDAFGPPQFGTTVSARRLAPVSDETLNEFWTRRWRTRRRYCGHRRRCSPGCPLLRASSMLSPMLRGTTGHCP